eukprot:COSAG02_NODE_293_length_25438_cov_52.630254_15_plen_50_part_00
MGLVVVVNELCGGERPMCEGLVLQRHGQKHETRVRSISAHLSIIFICLT